MRTHPHLLSILLLPLVPLSAPAVSPATHSLKADGTTETYRLISEAGFYTETSANMSPDAFMGHQHYNHISHIHDPSLDGYVFAFDIHIDYPEGDTHVTDGNKGTLIDRQRNEIKCMSSQPATVAKSGETITYTWKFMLPEGMLTTSAFCHIHQIKGMGDSQAVAHPVFTLTCRTSGKRQVLQCINVPYEGASNVNLAQIDLSTVTGRWIQARETFTVGRHGQYSLTLTDALTGAMIMNVDKSDIEVWRDTDDLSTLRGKWGIYRSLGEGLSLKSQLRSERVLFADFEIRKGDPESSITETPADCRDDNGPAYNLAGQPVDNNYHGIIVRKGIKILNR